MNKTIIGIDLGGTNLRIGAVDAENKILAKHIMRSDIITRAEQPFEQLTSVIRDFVSQNSISDVSAVSIGVPSSVAKDRKTVIYTDNLRNIHGEAVFDHTNLADELEKRLHVPVIVSHDTDNILLYDICKNHLEDASVVLGIYVGTGVGATVLIDGNIMTGAHGVAMDIGHMPFFKGDALCSCGRHGCCECYASGWRLQEIRKQYYPDEPIQDLFLHHANDTPLMEFVDSCAHIFAVMATIFNPEVIVAGGGVIEMNGFPRETFEQLVNQKTGSDVMSYGFRYLYSLPENDKGIIGAAIAARHMNLNK